MTMNAPTLIRIDRNSIKKNPDAGSTRTQAFRPAEITFEIIKVCGLLPPPIDVNKKDIVDYLASAILPKTFLDKVIISSFKLNTPYATITGIITSGDDSCLDEIAPTCSSITKQHSRGIINIDHAPTPQYDFYYENTLVKCNNCHKEVHWLAIEEHESEDEDSYLYEVCPECGEVNTFDYKLEKIEEVIKL